MWMGFSFMIVVCGSAFWNKSCRMALTFISAWKDIQKLALRGGAKSLAKHKECYFVKEFFVCFKKLFFVFFCGLFSYAGGHFTVPKWLLQNPVLLLQRDSSQSHHRLCVTWALGFSSAAHMNTRVDVRSVCKIVPFSGVLVHLGLACPPRVVGCVPNISFRGGIVLECGLKVVYGTKSSWLEKHCGGCMQCPHTRVDRL